MPRQYIEVVFKAGATRGYTYHNDGEPVAVDDEVKVPERRGDGWQRVRVIRIVDKPPSFETKGIVGKVEPVEDDGGEAFDMARARDEFR